MRSLFTFAFDEGLVDRPVRYGQGFAKPKKERIKAEREKHRAKHGLLMFEAAEIRLMLTALEGTQVTLSQVDEKTKEPVKVKLKPNSGLRAMVLLAANCGFGQTDISDLPC